jgi:hypothetical protein
MTENETLERIAAAIETMAAAMHARDARTYTWTPEGLPICPRHQVVMKERKKQGDTWYSHRITAANGDELFCRGYAGKNSPGFDIDAPASDNNNDDDTPPRSSTPTTTAKPTPRQATPTTTAAAAAIYPQHAEEKRLGAYFPPRSPTPTTPTSTTPEAAR